MSAREPRVLQVIGALVAGGAERFVVALACSLRQKGVSVAVFVMSNRRDGSSEAMAEALDRAGVLVCTGTTIRPSIGTVLTYRRFVQKFRPHVIHLHTPNTEVLHAMSRVRHGTSALVKTVHSSKMLSTPLVHIADAVNALKCVVACSDEAARQYETVFGRRARTVWNGARFDRALPPSAERMSLRRTMGLKDDKTIFLSIGRMIGDSLTSAPKAHDVLLEAWNRSEAWKMGGELHLLGEGDLMGELRGQAKQGTAVHFHGVVGHPEEWLDAADCFLMPSRYEGLPMAAIEAMGAGVFCVFTDIRPFRELEPTFCVWIEVDDVSALSEIIRHRVGRKERQEPSLTLALREKLGIGRTSEAYLAIYAESSRWVS